MVNKGLLKRRELLAVVSDSLAGFLMEYLEGHRAGNHRSPRSVLSSFVANFLRANLRLVSSFEIPTDSHIFAYDLLKPYMVFRQMHCTFSILSTSFCDRRLDHAGEQYSRMERMWLAYISWMSDNCALFRLRWHRSHTSLVAFLQITSMWWSGVMRWSK